jgi:hypothetical protein
MRAGNGKGLQPIIRERFSRPQDGFGAMRILVKQGAQWLRTGQVPVSPARRFGSPSCLRAAPLVPAIPLEPPPPFPCSRGQGAPARSGCVFLSYQQIASHLTSATGDEAVVLIPTIWIPRGLPRAGQRGDGGLISRASGCNVLQPPWLSLVGHENG